MSNDDNIMDQSYLQIYRNPRSPGVSSNLQSTEQ